MPVCASFFLILRNVSIIPEEFWGQGGVLQFNIRKYLSPSQPKPKGVELKEKESSGKYWEIYDVFFSSPFIQTREKVESFIKIALVGSSTKWHWGGLSLIQAWNGMMVKKCVENLSFNIHSIDFSPTGILDRGAGGKILISSCGFPIVWPHE